MPKKRLPENKGLPKRWKHQHGAYYYRVPPGQESAWDGKKMFRLGKTLSEAHREYAARVECTADIRTIADLLDRYMRETAPEKSPRTGKEYARYAKKLRAVFGHMGIHDILPRHINKYFSDSAAKTLAKREIEMFRHVYTKAVEWGYLNRHPFKGQIRLKNNRPRTRYIENWEIAECLALQPKKKKGDSLPMLQAYIRLKILTGMAQGDMLRLRCDDLKEDGIHIQRHKTKNSTGKRTIYTWTPALMDAVEQAKAARPVHISPFLFCNRRGESYVNEATGEAQGFQSIWQRFMKRVLAETAVKERFTEHDMRAKAASDADNAEHARALMSHADSKITQRVYMRKPETVRPIK